jgi:ABC-2 type transport system permease protein
VNLLRDTGVIWYREILRYKRNPRYLAAQIFFPLLFIIALGFGFGGIVELEGDVKYLDFLASGVLVFFIAGGALGGGFNLIEERKEGYLKTVIIAPINRGAVILGKIAGRVTLSATQLIIFLGILTTFTSATLDKVWLTFLSLILMAAIFVCIGILVASFWGDAEEYRMMSSFVMLPLYFLSGMFFPVSTLPPWLEAIALVNPLTYAVDLFRYSLLGVHEFNLLLSSTLLATLLVASVTAATIAFDKKFRE